MQQSIQDLRCQAKVSLLRPRWGQFCWPFWISWGGRIYFHARETLSTPVSTWSWVSLSCPILKHKSLHTLTLITECYWKYKETIHGTKKCYKVLETTALNKIFWYIFLLVQQFSRIEFTSCLLQMTARKIRGPYHYDWNLVRT